MGLEHLAIASAAGSGVFNARGARAQGRAIEQASNINAANILTESELEASRLRRAGRQEIGRQRAIMGASGVQSAGSPLELLTQNAGELERRAMDTQLAGKYASDIERMRGKVARKSASRISGASLFEGGTRALYYGHSLA